MFDQYATIRRLTSSGENRISPYALGIGLVRLHGGIQPLGWGKMRLATGGIITRCHSVFLFAAYRQSLKRQARYLGPETFMDEEPGRQYRYPLQFLRSLPT